mgnify:CR=1
MFVRYDVFVDCAFKILKEEVVVFRENSF